MIYCIAHYSFTYQSIKPSLWLYRRPFPPNLCCWWAIKILLNRQTKNTRFVCWPLYLPPTTNIVCPIHKTYNMIHLLIFIFSSGKWFNSLLYWNIENMGIIWCGKSTRQICINLWKVTGRNFHNYGISASHWPMNKYVIHQDEIQNLTLPTKPTSHSPTLTTNPIHYLISKLLKRPQILFWLNLNNLCFPFNSSIIFKPHQPSKTLSYAKYLQLRTKTLTWVGITAKHLPSVALHG